MQALYVEQIAKLFLRKKEVFFTGYEGLIIKYQTIIGSVIGSIIGAFLAATFGIITQKYLDSRYNLKEEQKIIYLMKNEMLLNYELAKWMAITKNGVYNFHTDCYDKFLDKLMLVKDEDIRELTIDIYTELKLYNSGNNSSYVSIINKIIDLNNRANWGYKLKTMEEIDVLIFEYQKHKQKGEIVEAVLANYAGCDKRGAYGIICSLNKIEKAITGKG